MKHFLYTTICTLFCSLGALAQLSVQVSDAHTAQAIEGAHVSLFKENNYRVYAVTDLEGIARFNTNGVRVLVEHVAYQNKEVKVSGKNQIHVFISPEKDELEEVVVTGKAKPVLASQSVRQIRVIDQARIQNQAAVNLKDLLTNDLNFRITEDGVLGSQLSLQGLSGAKIKILVDGVPVIGRLNGEIDLNQINLNDIERVEVVEGPMAVQYGTDAVAGTINLITKRKALAKPELDLNSYYESVGRYNFDGTMRFPLGKWFGTVSLGRNYFDGFDEDESTRNMQWDPKEQYFASAGLQRRFSKVLLRYRGDFFAEDITNRGAVGSTTGDYEPVDSGNWVYPHALDDHYKTYRINNAIYGDYYIQPERKLKAFFAYNYYRRVKKTLDRNLVTGEEIMQLGSDAQDTTVFGTWSSRMFYEHELVANIFSYQFGYDFNHERNVGQRIENGEKQITDVAVFAMGEYQPVKNLNIQPGLRYAYNSRFGAPLIASLAARYQLSGNWILRASYGQGFRAPTLKELYFQFVDVNHTIYGNEDLKAESSDNYQIGINYLKHYKNSSVDATLSGFFNDINNEIRLVQDIAPNEQYENGLYVNKNVAQTQTMGGNFTTKVIYKNLQTDLGVSIIGVKNELAFSDVAEQGGYEGFNFYPQYRFNVSYNFKKLGIRPSFFLNHTAERTDLQSSGGQLVYNTFSPYTMSDFSLQKHFWNKKINITIGAKNLFDVTTLNSRVAVTGGAHSSGGAQLLSYGRTYFARLQIHLP